MNTAILRNKLQLHTNIGIWLPIILIEICLAAVATFLPLKPMVVILISIPLLFYLLIKPFHAYLLTILLLPFWDVTLSSIGGVAGQMDIRYTQIAAVVAVLGWLLSELTAKKLSFEKNVLYFPIAILVGWLLLSFMWTVSLYFGIRDFLLTLYGVILFFLTINIVKDEKTLNTTLKTWTIVGLLCAFSGIIELITTTLPALTKVPLYKTVGIWGGTVRLSGLKENPHRLGFLLNVCLMITVPQLIIAKSRKYKIFLVSCIFSMLAVLTNIMSRSTWVGCIVGIVCCSFYSKQFAKIFIVICLVVLVLFVTVAPNTLQYVVIERFMGVFNPMETKSIIWRSSVWEAGIKMFKEHPLTGVGIGSFLMLAKQYGSIRLEVPHDLYLFFLSESGLIGFLIFLFLVFTIVTSITKGLKYISNTANKLVLFGLFIGLGIYFVQGIVVNFKFKEMEIWALLGLAMVALKIFILQEEKMKGSSPPARKTPLQ